MLIETTMESPIVPVILCGGSGSRLWPLSRVDRPKQYHRFYGEESLFQSTIRRLTGPHFASPLVLVNQRFVDETLAQFRPLGIEPDAIVVEPAILNTAPALAAAALIVARRDPQALMLATPADHVVRDPRALQEAIGVGVKAARAGRIVTFGIEPDHAETGYGYLARGTAVDGHDGVFAASFLEKPEREAAERMIAAGGHYWNAGIFLFTAGTLIDELALHAPQVLEAARAAIPVADADARRIELTAGAYATAPRISIDYAVMEKSSRIAVVPTDPGWCDVGAWPALWDISEKDADHNVVIGDAVVSDATGSYVLSAGRRLVAVHGIDDLVVVDTEDAVLVTSRDLAQGVRGIVERLSQAQRPEAVTPKRVERPWGSYESINSGPGFQVKHIIVKPGGRLSLQFHYHRSEHWTIVSGTARVTVADEVRILQPNESTYVPLGTMHRLENLGRVDLHMIEVQCGEYLGEDDIVRIDDVYGRAMAS